MRLNEISSAQRRLLSELASGISDHLEAHFVELPGADDARIGVSMKERDRNVVIEISLAILVQAGADAIGREILRTRMKARRDRMMFRAPPRALPKDVAPLFTPGPPRSGFRSGRR